MNPLTEASWTELTVERPSGTGRVFTRLLGLTEEGFYWDGEFNGMADVTDHQEIEFTSPTLRVEDATLDEARFRAVWVALKKHFPVLAARIEESNGGNTLVFVVSEERIETIALNEFEYIANGDDDKTRAVIERGRNPSPRHLSRDLCAAITVLRRSKTEYDLVLTTAHVVFDGMSSFNVVRTLCDLLSRWPHSLETPAPDLRLRLSMAPSCDSLYPHKDMSAARLRWRRAIAAVISQYRIEHLPNGHTIPNRRTVHTPHTPALSCDARAVALDATQTRRALAICHAQGVTLGHVLAVSAQLALSRLMRKRYDAGLITQDEWDLRRTTPTITGGPWNLRPHLAPQWLAAGGCFEMLVALGFFFAQLPYMPNPDTFTPRRFWHRARLVSEQVKAYERHPLFLEMITLSQPTRVASSRSAAEALRARETGENAVVPQPTPSDVYSAVLLHSMSSAGDIDPFCPFSFPIPQQDRAVPETLRRIRAKPYLRCRPAELNLGAASVKGELRMHILYDGNVYHERDVEEWLSEIRQVLVDYLCDGHPEGPVKARL